MDLRDIISISDLTEPYILLTEILELEDIFKIENVLNGRQIDFKKNICDIKQEQPELCLILGKEKALTVARRLSGDNIYFPTLKKSCLDKVKRLIADEFNGYNYKELSRKFGYSERHIYNIVKYSGKSRRYEVDEKQLSLWDL